MLSLRNLSILIILFASSCRSSEVFKQFEEINPNSSVLYILRPYQDVLVLNKYFIEVYKYKDDFKKSPEQKLIFKSKIKDGEYIILRLSEGYYRIAIPHFKNTFQILLIKNNEEYFYQVNFYSKGFMYFPEAFLNKITKKDAAERLLEFNRMKKHPQSLP